MLSLVYTPGVAEACLAIQENPLESFDLTCRGNTVALITDGSDLFGRQGGPAESAIPIEEGKSVLFKTFAGVDAFPLCLGTRDMTEIIEAGTAMAPTFGAICIDDISSPRTFTIADHLERSTDIAVFSNQHHGTGVLVLGALINALKVACDQMTSGYQTKLAVMRLAEQHMSREMLTIYHDINALLVSRKILPQIRPGYRKARTSAVPKSSPATDPVAKAEGLQESGTPTGSAAEIYSTLQQLLAGGSMFDPDMAAGSSAPPAASHRRLLRLASRRPRHYARSLRAPARCRLRSFFPRCLRCSCVPRLRCDRLAPTMKDSRCPKARP